MPKKADVNNNKNYSGNDGKSNTTNKGIEESSEDCVDDDDDEHDNANRNNKTHFISSIILNGFFLIHSANE